MDRSNNLENPPENISTRLKTDTSDHFLIPLQEKMVSFLPIDYWYSWLLVGTILGASAYITVLLSNGVMIWIGQLAVMYAIVLMLSGALPIWAYSELEKVYFTLPSFINLPSASIKEWFDTNVKRIFSTNGMIVSGILLSLAGMLSFILQTDYYSQPTKWFGTTAGNIVVSIVVAIMMIFIGMALHILIRTVIFIHELHKLPLKITYYRDPEKNIYVIGRLLQKFSIVTVITYGLITFTAYALSPFKGSFQPILISWLSFAGIFIMLFFSLPQYELHKAMVRSKNKQLYNLSVQISQSLDNLPDNPTQKNLAHVETLFDLHQHVINTPEWPINLQGLITVFTVVLFPIVLSIIEIKLIK